MRPRYGRILSAVSSLAVTAVALLGAAGAIPAATATGTAPVTAETAASAVRPHGAMSLTGLGRPARMRRPDPRPSAAESTALPKDSGVGKRVVFDISAQRVWLVDRGNELRRTYLVSGSLTDNLKPGTYEVYSTSRHAVGVDDSGTMQYMVRFARGERAAIGFHDIPVDGGELVQTRAELGTPQSHGCIRQWRPDARALWYFAIVGTKVVVLD